MQFIEVATLQQVSYEEIKRRHENITFPQIIDTAHLSSIGFEELVIEPFPQDAPRFTQVERATPVLTNGVWTQGYTQTPIEDTLADATENGVTTTVAQQIASILEDGKSQMLGQLATYRYDKEIAGIDVNGSSIRTDRESQATLTSAYTATLINPSTTINWKASGGSWVSLDASQVSALASAVVTHVQSCFNKEQSIGATITGATTLAQLRAIDFDTLWAAV